ncbi:MAG TPA: bifunctional glutamate N-acetyltransferase/amino-acid acetyltransferase ArgJ [Planctomycetota bacterium]|nr:bifunctional glutamate N-acetyltransferase/amino-acid acetyltransferase ArgJ [Planctomycetota bacterium]
MKKPVGVITRPAGFAASGASAGIKTTPGVPDVAVLACETGASGAAVFTTNKVCAAPVKVSREHLLKSRGQVRAVVVNSGNANACTGKRGMRDARTMAALTGRLLDVPPESVLVASTGVIGQPLPMDRVETGIRRATETLSRDRKGGRRFARGIMTTDRFPKEAEASFTVSGKRVRLAGVVKGAGMIAPNMATMLAFVTTDARVTPSVLRRLLLRGVARSFNRITVDGHMSTNDTCVALASGASGVRVKSGRSGEKFAQALDEVLLRLALQIVRDGEGAVRVAEVQVKGARTDVEAELAARAIADSPLVKTALFGADPNWGRIVSAAGACGCAFTEEKTSLRIGRHLIYSSGRPRPASKAVMNAMKRERVTFLLDLGIGRGSSVVYTCDIGYDYVRLNAEYHT